MRTFAAVFATTLALSLAACGGSSDSDSDSADRSASDRKSSKPKVEIVESGFGQADEYVQGIAIVTTKDEAAIGEFVTVSMNFLDKNGEILGTEEQVESFNWVGQELVLPVWLDLSENPKADVAKVDVSASLSDHGSAQDPREPLATVEAKDVKEGEFGNPTATFELSNPGNNDLVDSRVGVVCYDESGGIVGGTSEYPELIAAGKTIRLDADVTTSGVPAKCTAFPNYDVS